MVLREIYKLGISVVGALIVMLEISGAGFAMLGGIVASVAADQARMKASVQVTSNARYQVHELKNEGGNVVREYVSPSGNVFGVAWTGHQVPDYSQLLGSYTERITKAAQSRRNHHAPLSIQEPGFVFFAFGHMRFYSGQAYVPSLMPAGVLPKEIQ